MWNFLISGPKTMCCIAGFLGTASGVNPSGDLISAKQHAISQEVRRIENALVFSQPLQKQYPCRHSQLPRKNRKKRVALSRACVVAGPENRREAVGNPSPPLRVVGGIQ